MDRCRYRKLFLTFWSLSLLASCGGEEPRKDEAQATATPGALEVELTASVNLLQSKVTLTSQEVAPIEIDLVESEGRWLGSQEDLEPGSYEARAFLQTEDGWTIEEGAIPLEVHAGATGKLVVVFDQGAPLRSPTIKPHSVTYPSEDESRLELRVEALASLAAAGVPLNWTFTVIGPDLCRDRASWSSPGEVEGPAIAGTMEDGSSVTAALIVPRTEDLEVCQVRIEVEDAAKAKAAVELELKVQPIHLTSEE